MSILRTCSSRYGQNVLIPARLEIRELSEYPPEPSDSSGATPGEGKHYLFSSF